MKYDSDCNNWDKWRIIFSKGYLLLIFVLSFINSSYGQDFKVIGYLPTYRFALIDQIDLHKITHLNLAFANPNQSGNISTSKDIKSIVDKAHAADVQVFISLAGGGASFQYWETHLKPQNRSALIHNIINYTLDHELQGIDIDLEWDNVNSDYNGFVLELRDSVDKYGIILTAALPGTYRYPEVSDATLAAYDWINMMVYDLRGPWRPNEPGPHSPYQFAVNSINYWVLQGVPLEKLTLGVPFYGYDFTDQNNVKALTFNQIVGLNNNYAFQDQVGKLYYNGLETIADKAALALEKVSGIMIWELGQDNFDEYSLLDRIFNVVSMSTSVPENSSIVEIKAYPNPFNNEVTVEFNDPEKGVLQLLSIDGRLLQSYNFHNQNSIKINTSLLTSGFYLLRFVKKGSVSTHKLIKH